MKLAEGLKNNNSLKKLNLAWNSLGVGRELKIGEALGDALQYEHILHLDLSHNKFSLVDSLSIGRYLKSNHKLYGFHFEGNASCFVDS